MAVCPLCGRNLTKDERICWFCEQDVHEVIDEEQKPKITFKAASKGTIIDDFNELGKIIKLNYNKIKVKVSKKKK